MSEDEFNAAIEATRRGVAECMREYTHPGAQSVLRGVQEGLAQELAGAYVGQHTVVCSHCDLAIDVATALAQRPNVPDWVSCPLCMREINLARAAAQVAQDAAQHILGGLGAALGQAPSTTLTGAANGWSINGLLGKPMRSGYGTAPAYGEQGADTDGLAAVVAEWDQPPLEWKPTALRRYLVSDGHEPPFPGVSGPPNPPTVIDELTARIARKEAANEALVAKLNATMADAQTLQSQNESLQRQNEQWQAECKRLSALLVETQEELAQRMALPSNALRHGGVR